MIIDCSLVRGSTRMSRKPLWRIQPAQSAPVKSKPPSIERPEIRGGLQDIVGLYVDPPAHAVVLSSMGKASTVKEFR
jgi:hypothetical protein